MSVTVSNPADRQKIKDAISEISTAMMHIADQRLLIKESIEDLSEQFEIPKKTLRRMAKLYYEQKYNEVQAENEELSFLYEQIFDSGQSA